MSVSKINVLVNSIAGTGLPSTVVIPLDRTSTTTDLWDALSARFPNSLTNRRYILSTHQNNALSTTGDELLLSYTSAPTSDFLPLRLWAPLCGGKGGFGSQLRAAGGRMSSRKKRGDAEENGSSRNLDGRRIRTVNEAKALAEYLAVKPNMDKKQKAQRRERLEKVIEMAENKVSEIQNGGKGRLEESWIEGKRETQDRTRDAVLAAMNNTTVLGTSHGSISTVDTQNSDTDAAGLSSGSEQPTPTAAGAVKPQGKKPVAFFGFDEEYMSSSDEE